MNRRDKEIYEVAIAAEERTLTLEEVSREGAKNAKGARSRVLQESNK